MYMRNSDKNRIKTVPTFSFLRCDCDRYCCCGGFWKFCDQILFRKHRQKAIGYGSRGTQIRAPERNFRYKFPFKLYISSYCQVVSGKINGYKT